MRNIIVTGGIIALGKTPIPGDIPGGGPQPAWLRLIPDLRLLDGSAIPPVVSVGFAGMCPWRRTGVGILPLHTEGQLREKKNAHSRMLVVVTERISES